MTQTVTAKVCLRCDWRGETTERSCPRCDEALFGAGTSPSRNSGIPVASDPGGSRNVPGGASIPSPDTSSAAPHLAPAPMEATGSSDRAARAPVVVFVLAALALIALVGAWLDPLGNRPAVRSTPPPPEDAVPQTDYMLDLDTGVMMPLPPEIVGPQDRAGEAPVAGYAVSPDGSKLAFARPTGDGISQIFVANLDGSGSEQVTIHGWGAGSPAWSPDGSTIAYIGHRSGNAGHTFREAVFLLDLATGSSRQLTSHEGPTSVSGGPPSFTPDGGSVVYSASTLEGPCCPPGRQHVRIVPVGGGTSVRPLGNDAVRGWDARLSPDGSQVSTICRGGRLLCVANIDGTERRELVRSGDYIVSHAWSPDGTRVAYQDLHTHDVFVVDLERGGRTHVAEGANPVWLDAHTLIVEIDGCYDHALSARASGCSG